MDEPANAPANRVVAAVTAPPARPSDLEVLLCHLLPNAPVPTPPPQTKSTELEILLKRLLSGVPTPTPTLPTPPPQTGMAGVEALLQHLLPGTPGMASWARPGLECDSVLLLWQVGSQGELVPRNECDIPISVARVDGREGGQQSGSGSQRSISGRKTDQ